MKCKIGRSKIAGRLAVLLLATIFLAPLLAGVAAPAWAQGGNGGGGGGAGGVGFTGNPGGGGNGSGGGGGGGAGGGTGGPGGNGGDGGQGNGGAGGTSGSPDGANGLNACSPGCVGGGGGGGGGFNGNGAGTATISNASPLTGGTGGNGGGSQGIGGGGGGGAGGYGVVVTGGGASSNTSAIAGGAGGVGGVGGNGVSSGNGGAGGGGVQFTTGGSFTNSGIVAGGNGGTGGAGGTSGNGGNGGAGGGGVQFATGGSFTNSGTVAGGNGGAGGTAGTFGGSGGSGGSGGNGGAGIVSSGGGLTIINSGTVTGGLSADGVTRANAITFTGGTNVLELQAGSTITGNVVAFSTADTLRLGGSGTASFDVSTIGPAAQYQNFGLFAKTGSSTWTLAGTTASVTPWSINGGTLAISSDNNLGAAGGTLAFNGGTLQTTASLTSARTITLNSGGGTFSPNSGTTLTLGGTIGGTGGLTMNGGGTLILASTGSYSGGTAVSAGTLAVNGLLVSNVTVGSGGTLGGSGAIFGNVSGSGTLAPGNSIGNLTVVGSYSQTGGTYQVEVNAAGQGDRLEVAGTPGTATINGGTVNVVAASSSYPTSTTYTILNAAGGVSGTYSSVTLAHKLAFLTPSLSYDANNAYLTLAVVPGAYSGGGVTPNHKAVGAALDRAFATATADFATVIAALTGLDTLQGPAALDAISGQPYADFGTMNVNNSAMFMNALGQQMAVARGGTGGGQRQALAQACDIAACEGVSPWGAWASALGGLGSVLGDGNRSTLTYNFGGGAAGIDYRFDPRFLVGIGTGYTHGTQWVNSFMGQGWSDSVSVAAYGSFTQDGFYADALAGYAYFNNQLQRQIVIPYLQPRTATGSTAANQFLGQVEAGYKVPIYAPAAATLTPFGRFQAASGTQNGFSESGAQSLSLNVAPQTTTSLRTTLGADLAGAIGLGNERTLGLDLRLGWMHEYADTSRPITAAFAGAPVNAFTVYGAAPQRNSAVVGFQANTTIAAATQLYLRYDGEIGSGTDNHALNIGVRFSW
jgi:uncharacterized protein with beta-barrel porin domain